MTGVPSVLDYQCQASVLGQYHISAAGREPDKRDVCTPNVCQGRLADSNKTVTKDELLTMVKFGADETMKWDEGNTITDEDIDLILQRGQSSGGGRSIMRMSLSGP
jgi:hypothetical protein